MIYGEPKVAAPIRWAMVGGGRGSQIGYIHRCAALRDRNFALVAGAFDLDPVRGRDFGTALGVEAGRCYPDYRALFAGEAARPAAFTYADPIHIDAVVPAFRRAFSALVPPSLWKQV